MKERGRPEPARHRVGIGGVAAVLGGGLLSLAAAASPQLPPGFAIDKLFASTPQADAAFGGSVDSSGDRVVIGAAAADDPFITPIPGVAYVFERDTEGRFVETARLQGGGSTAGDDFGLGVAINGDIVAASAPWEPPGPLGPGCPVYVFEHDGEEWDETARLADSEFCDGGTSIHGLALSGGVLAATLPGGDEWFCGRVTLWERSPDTSWSRIAVLENPGYCFSRFGGAVDLDGDRLAVGADDDEIVYVYERQPEPPGGWVLTAELRASDTAGNQAFGYDVDLQDDLLVVGAFWDPPSDPIGAVYLFEHDPATGEWREEQKLTPPDPAGDDRFGISVAVEGDLLYVGASWHRSRRGATYLFQRDRDGDGTWGEVAKPVAPDAETLDYFGSDVAVGRGFLVSGSISDDDQATDAGAAYTFTMPGPALTLEGDCPGAVTVRVTGATPNGEIGLSAATLEGRSEIPGGPCAGFFLDLDEPSPLGHRRADGNGEASFSGDLASPVCGARLQAIDLLTCLKSDVTTVP